MYNANLPPESELPSTNKLLKSTVIAMAAAGVLLLTIVMPAEYGIDPTGVGSLTGLKRMGEIKMSLAEEAAAEERAAAVAISGEPALPIAPVAEPVVEAVAEPAPVTTPESVATGQDAELAANIRSDQMQVTLAPDQGTEIKVTMAKGKQVEYNWQSDGGAANFDVHGDSTVLDISYHNYSKGAEQASEGELEAAFDGNHGWFWRNRTPETITITLNTRGEYTDIKHLQ